MTVAVASRVLQFRAGPNESEFHACAEHLPQLESGDAGGLFFPTDDRPVRAADPDDEFDCYWCREGGD